MRYRILIALLGIAPLPGIVSGQQLPPNILRGLDELSRGRSDSATSSWTGGWLPSQDSANGVQLRESLEGLAKAGGTMRGWEFLKVLDLTRSLKRVYVLLRGEPLPVYVLLVLYQSQVGGCWTVITINWNTDPDRVLPPSLWGNQKPE